MESLDTSGGGVEHVHIDGSARHEGEPAGGEAFVARMHRHLSVVERLDEAVVDAEEFVDVRYRLSAVRVYIAIVSNEPFKTRADRPAVRRSCTPRE